VAVALCTAVPDNHGGCISEKNTSFDKPVASEARPLRKLWTVVAANPRYNLSYLFVNQTQRNMLRCLKVKRHKIEKVL